MIKEFFRNLAKIIHLRSIIGYNGLVFALKKTPVIGKIIPDRLYSTTFLKVIYWIFHVIKEVFKLFVGKIIGLGTIYVASWILSNTYVDYGQAPGITQSDLYASFALLFSCMRFAESLLTGLISAARPRRNTWSSCSV